MRCVITINESLLSYKPITSSFFLFFFLFFLIFHNLTCQGCNKNYSIKVAFIDYFYFYFYFFVINLTIDKSNLKNNNNKKKSKREQNILQSEKQIYHFLNGERRIV